MLALHDDSASLSTNNEWNMIVGYTPCSAMFGGVIELDGQKQIDSQTSIARQCIEFVARSTAIDDSEFESRLGFSRRELEEVLTDISRPANDRCHKDVTDAVNNCFNEICHGLTIDAQSWDQWFTCTKDDVQQAYEDWLTLIKR